MTETCLLSTHDSTGMTDAIYTTRAVNFCRQWRWTGPKYGRTVPIYLRCDTSTGASKHLHPTHARWPKYCRRVHLARCQGQGYTFVSAVPGRDKKRVTPQDELTRLQIPRVCQTTHCTTGIYCVDLFDVSRADLSNRTHGYYAENKSIRCFMTSITRTLGIVSERYQTKSIQTKVCKH